MNLNGPISRTSRRVVRAACRAVIARFSESLCMACHPTVPPAEGDITGYYLARGRVVTWRRCPRCRNEWEHAEPVRGWA